MTLGPAWTPTVRCARTQRRMSTPAPHEAGLSPLASTPALSRTAASRGLPVQKLEDAAAADGPAEVESVDDFVRATALPLRHRRTARPGGGGDGGGGEASASPRRRSQL